MKRMITSIFSLFRGKRGPLTAVLLAFGSVNTMFAQTWVGEALPEESGEYYLYNKDADAFLTGGNTWGTHASLGQPGLLCTVAVKEGKYTIYTGQKNDRGTIKDCYLRATNDNEAFVDQTIEFWTFEDLNPEDGLHEFALISQDNRHLYWDNNTKLKISKIVDETSERKAQWMLVSKAQREESLKAAAIDKPVDATFYINSPGFDPAFLHWQETHDGGSVTLSGNNANGTGYRNACAEARNNNSFDIYQELTVKPGAYEISCQGFYRPGANVGERFEKNAILYANARELPIQLLLDDGKGVPGDLAGTANAFFDGRYKGNTIKVVVLEDGALRLGIKKNVALADDWTAVDNFSLTYLGNDKRAIFEKITGELETLKNNFQSLGAEGVVSDIQVKLDKYPASIGDDQLDNARAELLTVLNKATAVYKPTQVLLESITEAKAAQTEWGGRLSESRQQRLAGNIADAEKAVKETGGEEMLAKVSDFVGVLNNNLIMAKSWLGWSYSLKKAMELAEKLQLTETQAYQDVAADYENKDLTFAGMFEHLDALNKACREAMTVDFLKNASEENPIELTNFMTNPNIYQEGPSDQAHMPRGWIAAEWGSVNNTAPTTGSFMDTDLFAYSWSGNDANTIGKAHYYSEIGGNLTLPDGHYRLKAATYITRQPEAVKLYASLDNETMETANFNNNRATYDNALGIKEGTTTELDINVTGGRLYFGVKGVATVGGNGASWNADNFRLFYVGAPEDLAVTIGEHGVSTYYAPHTFTVADGLTAGVVKAATEEGKVTVDWCYEAGATVPTHTGVILKGAQEEYTCSFSAENVTADAENLLRGTLVDETINEAGFKYYKLSDGDNGLGFYWDSEDGTSIANKAGKAYLALPGEEVAKVNFFSWNLDATGVEAVESDMDEIVDVYALSGVCVRSQVKKSKALNGLQKGIYIINGKKIIK